MAEPNPIGTPSSDSIARLIDRLSNADIRWDGTFVGLKPTIAGGSARQLLDLGDAAIPGLIRALEDDSKFVAAHVLLTLISGVEYQTLPWNSLVVDIAADGTANIDPSQRFDLIKRWTRWYHTEPRPTVLPAGD